MLRSFDAMRAGVTSRSSGLLRAFRSAAISFSLELVSNKEGERLSTRRHASLARAFRARSPPSSGTGSGSTTILFFLRAAMRPPRLSKRAADPIDRGSDPVPPVSHENSSTVCGKRSTPRNYVGFSGTQPTRRRPAGSARIESLIRIARSRGFRPRSAWPVPHRRSASKV